MALKNSPAWGLAPFLKTFPATLFSRVLKYITFYRAKHGDKVFCIEEEESQNKIWASFRKETVVPVSILGRFLVRLTASRALSR